MIEDDGRAPMDTDALLQEHRGEQGGYQWCGEEDRGHGSKRHEREGRVIEGKPERKQQCPRHVNWPKRRKQPVRWSEVEYDGHHHQ